MNTTNVKARRMIITTAPLLQSSSRLLSQEVGAEGGRMLVEHDYLEYYRVCPIRSACSIWRLYGINAVVMLLLEKASCQRTASPSERKRFGSSEGYRRKTRQAVAA